MPLRTITMPDGTTRTRMIRNIHPDGTEFLPEEFTITGRNEEERRALTILAGIVSRGMERKALEAEKAAKAKEEAEKQDEK